ncbi:c-type cytochrome [Sphingobium sp.]|uniref:c-type cytochrome n=1 Tax=Sphingobium sp. TaxID=1912891 RepID=UPI002C2CB5CE|nr:c-type cytochrome [Sphingobium sp.]HUD95408.1 c-type cytochrome [Sphingobium sp.]
MIIRITWRRLLAFILGMGALGMVFAWSGAMQISASSGHWRVTDWFLHWVMRNSVRTYSLFQSPTDPRDDSGLVSAAGHYRQACQVCHGAPGVRPSPVMQKATPPAPDLSRTAGEWRDRELFWIIRHGVKLTGMPAWGVSDRPDEVRRMVAFVRSLPDMTPARYQMLTQEAGLIPVPGIRSEVVAACTGCHGIDGRGRGQADIPVLGGQRPAYLLAAMQRFASGERAGAVMQAAVAHLSVQEMEGLARYFAAMPGLADVADRPIERVGGKSGQPVPACENCHAPGKGAPIIYGQKASYIAGRLHAWQGDPNVIDARKSSATMAVIARRIPTARIEALARSLEYGGNGRPEHHVQHTLNPR